LIELVSAVLKSTRLHVLNINKRKNEGMTLIKGSGI